MAGPFSVPRFAEQAIDCELQHLGPGLVTVLRCDEVAATLRHRRTLPRRADAAPRTGSCAAVAAEPGRQGYAVLAGDRSSARRST